MSVLVFQKRKTAKQLETSRPHTAQQWRDNGLDYVMDKGIDVLSVLMALLAAWLVLRLAVGRIERWGRRSADEGGQTAREQRARTAAKLVRNAGRGILIIVGIVMVLKQLDFDISPLVASAGVLGLAISFGSQSLVRDYVTGFFLQLEHQFALGEVIRIGGVEGTVENISLRLVYLRDGTGALHMIPNGTITQVTNLTRSWGRVTIDVEVPWKDAARAEDAVREAATALGRDPAWADALLDPPRVAGIEKIAGGGVTLRTVVRIDPYRRDEVARDLRRRIKEALDRAGIATMPPSLLPTA